MSLRRLWLIGLGSLIPLACSKENNFEKAALAVSRATAVTAGTIANAITADTRCGFQSQAVQSAVVVSGEPGARGSARWTVDGCTLEFAETSTGTKDCAGTVTKVRGRAKVKATLVLEGRVTGDPKAPILPLSDDSLHVNLEEVRLSGFTVLQDGVDGAMTVREGTIRGTVSPRLGQSASLGACTIPTSNAKLRGINLEKADVFLESSKEANYLGVDSSSISADVGKLATSENRVSGVVTLFGQSISYDPAALDENYDAAKFTASYACASDLVSPPSFECTTPAENDELAQGVGRLMTGQLAAVVAGVVNNQDCGFASGNAIISATTQGEPGAIGTYTLNVEKCAINFLPGTANTDCQGSRSTVEGLAVVSATWTIRGYLTGNPSRPVVPVEDQSSTIELREVELSNFSAHSGTTAVSLTVVRGKLSGQVVPRVARSAQNGACSIPTPSSRLSYIATDLLLDLRSGQGSIRLGAPRIALDATAGDMGTSFNEVHGQVSFDDQRFTLAPGTDLVPGLTKTSFDAGWTCTADLAPIDRFTCGLGPTISEGIAHLAPLPLGTLVELLEADTSCGFSSPAAQLATTFTGTISREGTVSTSLGAGCSLSFPRKVVVGTDCTGGARFVEGRVSVRGTRTLRGFLTGNPSQPLVPTSRDAASYQLTADFDGFRVTTSSGGPTLTFASGRASASIAPRTALDTTTGVCSIPTPVLSFSRIAIGEAVAVLASDQGTFRLTVKGSTLTAQVGPGDATTNALSGAISYEEVGRIESHPIADARLDPSFDAAAFQASFACRPNLSVPASDALCSFRGVLGGAAARFLAQGLGAATGIVTNDTTCGFSSVPVVSAPSRVVGMAGMPGLVAHRVNACAISVPVMNPSLNCLGDRAFVSGGITVSGTRTTTGLRGAQGNCPACVQLAVPLTRTGVVYNFDRIAFGSFETHTLTPEQSMAPASARLLSGTISATVTPILGESAANMGTFSVVTPVTQMRIVADHVLMAVDIEGSHFTFSVDAANLQAASGRFMGAGNQVSGMITIDGRPVPLGPTPLIDDYDQRLFDLGYSCTPDLRATIPPT